MDPSLVGFLGLSLALVLIFVGLPIGFAFLLVGFLGMAYLSGLQPGLAMFGILPYKYSTSYTLAAVPLFTFMGMMLFQAGISSELFDMGYKWLGRLPGGLNHAVVVACGAFGACTGSSTTGAAAFGTVALPEMRRLNYDLRLSLGTIAAAGSLGIMIPPSLGFIVYGLITEQSVAKLFMAGILPGALEVVAFMALIALRVKLRPGLAPPGDRFTWTERLVSLKGSVSVLIVAIVVLGGMYGGFFTATEAAGVGAFAALALAAARKRLVGKATVSALMDTMRIAVMIFFVIIGVMLFSSFLALTGVPQAIGQWIGALNADRYVVLSLILLTYIPLGMFMEAIGMMTLTLPIYFPLIIQLGFDPIWFGVLMIMMMEIGVLTPPVGMNCFVVAGVAKEPVEKVFASIWPFVLVECLIVAIIIAVPEISLLIPNLMR